MGLVLYGSNDLQSEPCFFFNLRGREVRRPGKDDKITRSVFLNEVELFLSASALSRCHIQPIMGYHPANQFEVRGAAVKVKPTCSGATYGETSDATKKYNWHQHKNATPPIPLSSPS